MEQPVREYKEVFTVSDRKDGKQAWVRLGAAFPNRDGSLTVLLDGVPVNGRLVIRDKRTGDWANGGGGRGAVRFHGRESVEGAR